MNRAPRASLSLQAAFHLDDEDLEDEEDDEIEIDDDEDGDDEDEEDDEDEPETWQVRPPLHDMRILA